MSLETSLAKFRIFSNSNSQRLSSLDYKIPIILPNIIIFPPENVSFGSLKKNGCTKEINCVSKNANYNILKTYQNLFKFNGINNSYIFSINNQKNSRIQNIIYKDLKTKSLEATSNKDKEISDFIKKKNLEGHIYKKTRNEELYNQVFLKFPLISDVFKQNLYERTPENLNKKNKIPNLDISFLKKQPPINEKSSSNNIISQNPKICGINIPKPKKKKYIFNIPDNFLIDYDLKEINITIIPNNNNYFRNSLIELDEAENYFKKICQNVANTEEDFEHLNYLNNYKEKQYLSFLQKKKKVSQEDNEIENIYHVNSENKRKRNKKRKKKNKRKKNKNKLTLKIKKLNKIDNRKDGKTISLFLNEIQINKNYLDNFPFYPMLNNKEFIKIEFLKGLIVNKDLIKMNKKAKLINDERNLSYIENKIFDIIYQHKKKGNQYFLHINNYNILYLFFYYYYQIQEDVKLLNKLYYSHRSKNELTEVKMHLEILIKKCNQLNKEISK